MRTRHSRTTDDADPRRRRRDRSPQDGDAGRPGDLDATPAGGESGGQGYGHGRQGWPGDGDGDARFGSRTPTDGYRQERGTDGYRQERGTDGYRQDRGSRAGASGGHTDPAAPAPVVRTPTGWRVGDEEVSDLTSAMVLADLLAADLPAEGPPTPGGPPAPPGRAPSQAPSGPPPGRAGRPGAARAGRAEADGEAAADIRKLKETVAQLEHALTVRVRVEQAIGVLAERHRLRPRQAFELLRSAARSRGRRVMEVANEVVDSATNPLLRIPDELAKPPAQRRRGRAPRHMLGRD